MWRLFLTLKKGYTPETTIFTTTSRNNHRKISLVATSWTFVFNFFTGILPPTTLWIFTQGYSPTWEICRRCKMSEYLLNNVRFKLFDIVATSWIFVFNFLQVSKFQQHCGSSRRNILQPDKFAEAVRCSSMLLIEW